MKGNYYGCMGKIIKYLYVHFGTVQIILRISTSHVYTRIMKYTHFEGYKWGFSEKYVNLFNTQCNKSIMDVKTGHSVSNVAIFGRWDQC